MSPKCMRCNKLILSTPSNGGGSSKNSQDEPSALYKNVLIYKRDCEPKSHAFCIAISEKYVARACEDYIYITRLNESDQMAVPAMENVRTIYTGSIHNHTNVVKMAFNSDSTQIVSVDSRRKISLWEVKTGENLKTAQMMSGVHCIAFSPDNQYIAIAHSHIMGGMSILNAETLEPVHILREKDVNVRCFAFHPDSSPIATAEGKTLKIWNLQTTREISSKTVNNKVEVGAVAWSNKGNLLATASVTNDDIKLLNVKTMTIESTFESGVKLQLHSTNYFFSMAFNSDDSKLACHFGDHVQVWDTSNKTLKIKIPVEQSLAFLPVVCFQGPQLIISSGNGVEVYCEERASGR